jgi:hypothetical protein
MACPLVSRRNSENDFVVICYGISACNKIIQKRLCSHECGFKISIVAFLFQVTFDRIRKLGKRHGWFHCDQIGIRLTFVVVHRLIVVIVTNLTSLLSSVKLMITTLLFQVKFTFLLPHGWFALKVDQSGLMASVRAHMEAASRRMASEKVRAEGP